MVEMISNGKSDEEVLAFIRGNYRLVLLTEEETIRLNRLNRSRITEDRLEAAGISVVRGD
jgi:hypothetical protein